MRLIDVDALRADYGMAEDCKNCKTGYRSCEYDRIYSKMDFCGWLDDAPTVDAVPVVRGEWVGSDSQCGIACSVCGVSVDDFCCSADYIDMNYQPNFCPNCGAVMRKDGEHEIN